MASHPTLSNFVRACGVGFDEKTHGYGKIQFQACGHDYKADQKFFLPSVLNIKS